MANQIGFVTIAKLTKPIGSPQFGIEPLKMYWAGPVAHPLGVAPIEKQMGRRNVLLHL